jgi:inorganic pyrophosphatase/exopolyphosphatase
MFTHVDHTEIEGKIAYASLEKECLNLHIEDLPQHRQIVKVLAEKYRENWSRGLGAESFLENMFLRTNTALCSAIFVGHVNTDLDSIAGAVCAAELFGGMAARAEVKINGEVEHALEYAGLEAPPTFDEVNTLNPHAKVCLVDHSELDQMTPTLRNDSARMKRIVGLIDHHAVASSFSSTAPLFIDLRPWGSMSTIVFHMYLRNRVPLSKSNARLMLCAILSDTLNLKSGTTTPADRFGVAMLAEFGEVEDILGLAMSLFEAKTKWIVNLGAYEMVRGDQKNFTTVTALHTEGTGAHVSEEIRWSIAVLEVTTMAPVLTVAEEIITQLKVFKYEKGDYIDTTSKQKKHDTTKECHCAMLFVVDTVNQKSVALICGRKEKLLAQAAFPNGKWGAAAPNVRSPSKYIRPEDTLCDVGGLVSRKLEFVPMCMEALQKGVPDWFTNVCPSSQSQLKQALESDSLTPISYDTQVQWDKATLVEALFDKSRG